MPRRERPITYESLNPEEREMLAVYMQRASASRTLLPEDHIPLSPERRKIGVLVEKVLRTQQTFRTISDPQELAQIIGMPEEVFVQIVQSDGSNLQAN